MSEDQALSFQGKKCLVTGGAGFIGSNLTRALLAQGAEVVVLDSLVTGKRAHLPSSAETAGRLTLIEEDLCDCERLPDLVASVNVVFHMAANVGNIRSLEDPSVDARTNVQGSVRLLDCCRNASIERLVYSSSSAGYGEARELPIDESAEQNPESFYALSKLTAERYFLLAAALYGIPAVALRYFNVFGLPMEKNDYTGVISIFFERLHSGDPLTIYGDGEQFRDFIYVADVVQANLLAAARGKPGQVYNIGTGQATSIKQLAEAMIEVTGLHSEIQFEPFRQGEVRRSLADISRARRDLGFSPTVDLMRGLGDMWRTLGSPS